MTNDVRDKKMSTIEALLAKAESTTSPEEAEALTAKAEELMIRYGIEQAMIASRKAQGNVQEEIVKVFLPMFEGRYASTIVTGSWYVAKAMSGEAVQGYRRPFGRKGVQLILVGYQSDVAQAERLINSLALQAIVARDKWWNEYKKHFWGDQGDSFIERRTFVERFFEGAAARLTRERNVAVKEAESTTAGTDLVLRDRTAAVKDYMKGLGLRKGGGSRNSYGRAGGSAGYAAGQRANVGTTGVGAGRRGIGR